jgi:hypothetical protein
MAWGLGIITLSLVLIDNTVTIQPPSALDVNPNPTNQAKA